LLNNSGTPISGAFQPPFNKMVFQTIHFFAEGERSEAMAIAFGLNGG
jgi:hypothetical protein